MKIAQWLRKRIKTTFLRLCDHEGMADASQQICFVISSPRSGSTWLERSLNGSKDVYCTENRLFGRFCEVWPDGKMGSSSGRITFDEFWFLWSRYQDTSTLMLNSDELYEKQLKASLKNLFAFQRRVSGKNIIVDKITPYLGTSETVLSSIRRYFPNASLIKLTRDGRDVLTSGVFDWISRKDYGLPRYEKYVNADAIQLERFFNDDDLEVWSKYWCEPLEAWEALAIEPDASIKYEEMLEDTSGTLQRVFAAIECDASSQQIERCIEAGSFEKMSGGRKTGHVHALAKVRKGVAGDWKNYFTRWDGQQFERLTHGWLVKAGYEKEHDWWMSLPEKISI